MPIVFKDKLSAGISFPLNSTDISERLTRETVALYFVSTATWVREVKPLHLPRLPVLRLQRARVVLRVRNERVAPLPDGCSLHAIVYAVPSRVRKIVSEALSSGARLWANDGSARTGVAFVDSEGQLTFDPKLPNWW